MAELLFVAMIAAQDDSGGAGMGAILGVILLVAMLVYADNKTHPR